jgi:hypothetical protein
MVPVAQLRAGHCVTVNLVEYMRLPINSGLRRVSPRLTRSITISTRTNRNININLGIQSNQFNHPHLQPNHSGIRTMSTSTAMEGVENAVKAQVIDGTAIAK